MGFHEPPTPVVKSRVKILATPFVERLDQENWFISQIYIGLIRSHKESPNLWHVISQLWSNLNWINIVPERQGSAAHEIQKTFYLAYFKQSTKSDVGPPINLR